MNQHEISAEEFDMLLNEVLDTIVNLEPTDALRHKVLMRLQSAPISRSDHRVRVATMSNPRLLLFTAPKQPERSSLAIASAIGLHAAAIFFIALLIQPNIHVAEPKAQAQATLLTDLPLVAPPRLHAMGGGGGQSDHAPVSKGTPPKFATQQIVSPKIPPLEQPEIAVEPTIDVQRNLKMTTSMPDVGIASAPHVGVSMGNGSGNGLGLGYGSGMGPGMGGDTGGGVRQVGGGVSAPIEVYRVEPEFSEEARKAKISGNVLVNLWVDKKGRVTHVSVLKGLGMGLDEKAIEAVKQFRFKPAMEDGKPVTVEMNIDVNFQIF